MFKKVISTYCNTAKHQPYLTVDAFGNNIYNLNNLSCKINRLIKECNNNTILLINPLANDVERYNKLYAKNNQVAKFQKQCPTYGNIYLIPTKSTKLQLYDRNIITGGVNTLIKKGKEYYTLLVNNNNTNYLSYPCCVVNDSDIILSDNNIINYDLTNHNIACRSLLHTTQGKVFIEFNNTSGSLFYQSGIYNDSTLDKFCVLNFNDDFYFTKAYNKHTIYNMVYDDNNDHDFISLVTNLHNVRDGYYVLTYMSHDKTNNVYALNIPLCNNIKEINEFMNLFMTSKLYHNYNHELTFLYVYMSVINLHNNNHHQNTKITNIIPHNNFPANLLSIDVC